MTMMLASVDERTSGQYLCHDKLTNIKITALAETEEVHLSILSTRQEFRRKMRECCENLVALRMELVLRVSCNDCILHALLFFK